MQNEPLLMSCPNGHSLFLKEQPSETSSGPVIQQVVCPLCGRPWQAILPYPVTINLPRITMPQ